MTHGDALVIAAQVITEEAAKHPRMSNEQRTGVLFAVTVLLKIAERLADKPDSP